jgi:hypothetical protein
VVVVIVVMRDGGFIMWRWRWRLGKVRYHIDHDRYLPRSLLPQSSTATSDISTFSDVVATSDVAAAFDATAAPLLTSPPFRF